MYISVWTRLEKAKIDNDLVFVNIFFELFYQDCRILISQKIDSKLDIAGFLRLITENNFRSRATVQIKMPYYKYWSKFL
jgi:hypothetical protein